MSEFPVALKFNNFQYAANVLKNIKGRPEWELETLGDKLLVLLSNFRSIDPQKIDLYYENLYPVISNLFKYSSLAESCSKSGAYTKQRIEHLTSLKSLILTLEIDEFLMTYLASMHIHVLDMPS